MEDSVQILFQLPIVECVMLLVRRDRRAASDTLGADLRPRRANKRARMSEPLVGLAAPPSEQRTTNSEL
jgi:hypothetical protein